MAPVWLEYALGLTMILADLIGGIALGVYLSDRRRRGALGLAVAMVVSQPVMTWLLMVYMARQLGLPETPQPAMALLALLPNPILLAWCAAAFLATRRARLRWPGLTAMALCGVLSLAITGEAIYRVFVPAYHSYGFIR